MSIEMYTLPNGLRVVGEYMPHVRSCAIGLFIGVGSQYETANRAGISHFMEHMMFKGTETRSAKDIAEQMDRVGGQINAYTAKECTCIYTRALEEHLPVAADMVFDLAMHPAFDPADLEREKGVVIEEIAMAADDPEDMAHEKLLKAHYGNQRIARPILGTAGRVSSFTREDMIAFHRGTYRPQNAVFSIAGRYSSEKVREMLEKLTENWTREGMEKLSAGTMEPVFGTKTRQKSIEQVHICMGYPGLPVDDPRNYELTLFNSVYGGAMSSRLFQHIREELGLAYSVYSEPSDYTGSGIMTVYAATNPDSAGRVVDEILRLTEEFAEKGMTEEEFATAREQVRAEIILGNESVSSRMQSNGRRMLLMNTVRTEEQILQQLLACRLEQTNELLKKTLTSEHSLCVVGRNAKELARALRGE